MTRVAFSIRFPPELVEALDRIAERRGQSRSDLVEILIRDMDAEDRVAVVRTTVVGAPTERRNLRLSTESLQRLKELAGDLEPSDFLRRMVAYLAAMVPPELLEDSPARGNGHQKASFTTSRRVHGRGARVHYGKAGHPDASALGIVVVAVVLLGLLVSFIMWLIHRSLDAPSSDSRTGQLSDGSPEKPDA